MYRLGYHDLWYDEVITLSKLPGLNFLKSWNPPFYYALLAGWVKLFGASEVSLRLPSLLFSLACVPLVYFLGKELFGKSAGLFASFIIALSPFQLWYAQEARGYSAMLFFGLLSSCFQFLFVRRRADKYLYGYALSTILGIHTHTYYFFFVVCQLAYLFVRLRAEISKRIAITALLVLLSFIPLLKKYLVRLSYVINGYWIPEPGWRSMLITVENFLMGYHARPLEYFLSGLLALFLVVLAVASVARKRSTPEGLTFCSVMFAVPTLLVFVFSLLFVPVYVDRGLIVSSPYYYLILGFGLSIIGNKPVRMLTVAGFLVFLTIGINGFINDRMAADISRHVGVTPKKLVKPAVEFIGRNSASADLIAFTHDSISLPFLWYSFGRDPSAYYAYIDDAYSYPGPYRFIFSAGDVTPSYKQLREENTFNILVQNAGRLKFERLWVLFSDWPRDGSLSKNSLAVKKWLDENFDVENRIEFDGLWVYVYKKRASGA